MRSSTRAIDQSRFAFSRVYKLLEESETEPDKIQQWKDNANPETYHCDMEEIFSAWKRLKLTSRQLAKALEMDVLLLLASKQADVMHGYAGAAEKSAVLTFFNNVVRQWLMSSPNYCCQCAKDETWPLGRLSLGFPHAQSCGNDCDW